MADTTFTPGEFIPKRQWNERGFTNGGVDVSTTVRTPNGYGNLTVSRQGVLSLANRQGAIILAQLDVPTEDLEVDVRMAAAKEFLGQDFLRADTSHQDICERAGISVPVEFAAPGIGR